MKLKLGHIAIYSPQILHSLTFWRDIVGMTAVQYNERVWLLSFDPTLNHHDLALIDDPAVVFYEKSPQFISHIGIEVGTSREDLDQLIKRLEAGGIECSQPKDRGFMISVTCESMEGGLEVEFYVTIGQAPWQHETNPEDRLPQSVRPRLVVSEYQPGEGEPFHVIPTIGE